MIDTLAEVPAYSPVGVPVTAMATGKEATLELPDGDQPDRRHGAVHGGASTRWA